MTTAQVVIFILAYLGPPVFLICHNFDREYLASLWFSLVPIAIQAQQKLSELFTIPEVCDTGECETVARYINYHINETENVCDSPYAFYCGLFVTPEYDILNVQKRLIWTGFPETLDREIFDPQPTLYHAYRFYRACVDTEHLWRSQKTLLPDEMVWPTLTRLTDWLEFLILARKNNIEHNYFFTLDAAFDDEKTRWIIKMSKPKYNRNIFDNANVKDITKLCQYWYEACESAKDIEDVIKFAKEILSMVDRIEMYKYTPSYQRISINDLQKKTAVVGSWLEFLRNITNLSTLSKWDEILYDLNDNFPQSPDYLRKLERLIIEYGPKIWMNYFAINLILDECYFMPTYIQDICSKYVRYTKELFCSEKTISKFQGVFEYAYASTDPYELTHTMVETLLDMIDDMKKSFIEGFMERFKPEEKIKRKLEKWLAATEIEVGNDGPYNETQFDRDYDRYQRVKRVTKGPTSSLHDSYRMMNNFAFSRTFALLKSTSDEEILAPTKLPGSKAAVYRPDVNKIFLQPFLLEAPLFAMDRPPALNYGGLGTIIGRELVRAALHSSPIVKKYLVESDTTAMSCINAQHGYMLRNKMKTESTLVQFESDMTETFLGAMGTYTAYRAYRSRHSDESQRSYLLKDLNGYWTGDQLFWKMASIPNCYELGGYFQKLSESHQTPAHRIRTQCLNSASFNRAHNCPSCPECHIFLAEDPNK